MTTYQDKIIDGHCHLASTHFIPEAFFQGMVDNIAAKLTATNAPVNKNKLMSMYLSQAQDHEGEALISEMDKADIAQSVVLLPDFTYVLKSDLTIAEMFAHHYKVQQQYADRLFVFAGVDPRWGQDGVDLFEKGIKDYGFRGLKLYPPCGYSASDKMLYPYYELCRHYKLPVLLHIGPTSPVLSFEFTEPYYIDQAALDFPEVNFILAHGGVVHVAESTQLCAFRANIYCDTGALLGSLHPQGWQIAMRELFAKGINHKIIFGTDWPVFRMSGGQKKIIQTFQSEQGPLAKVSRQQAKWIMANNIQRLLGII